MGMKEKVTLKMNTWCKETKNQREESKKETKKVRKNKNEEVKFPQEEQKTKLR